MRLRNLLILLIMTVLNPMIDAFAAPVSKQYVGIDGAEIGTLTTKENVHCYFYSRYVVVVSPFQRDQELIRVYKRSESQNTCPPKGESQFEHRTSPGAIFHGISDHFLFEQGGVDRPYLSVHDILKRDTVLSEPIYDVPPSVNKHVFTFETTRAPEGKEKCPDYDEASSDGQIVVVFQKQTVDLNTGIRTNTGTPQCSFTEPGY